MYVRIAAVVAIAALLGGAGRAQAGDVRTVPEGYRYLGPDHADSSCIGEVSTPECAAETYLACSVRADPSLCALVGIEDKAFGFVNTRDYEAYRIVDILPVPAERKLPSPDGESWYTPGLVEVRIRYRSCNMDEGCPPRNKLGDSREILFLAPAQKGWRLRRWAWGEGLETCFNEDPVSPSYNRMCDFIVDSEELPWINEYD